jgi:23S rRNA (guanosine2251-2'-O)-methyltransferase
MGPAGGSDKSQLIYGLHAVREALRGGTRPLIRLLVTRQDRQMTDVVKLARAAGVPVHVEPPAALDRLVPDGRHQGIVGLIASKPYTEPDDILKYAQQQGEPPLLLILDGIEDPHNLGAILRTAEAAGVHGVFLPERRSAGLTGSVAKASAGALEYLRVSRVPNISRLIEQLQAENIWVYALDPQATKPYTTLDFKGAIALVLGGEGAGVRAGVLAHCDERVGIPMTGRVESLNVSVAAGVVLFEALRQRLVKSKP